MRCQVGSVVKLASTTAVSHSSLSSGAMILAAVEG